MRLQFNPGELWIVGSAFCWGLYTVLVRRCQFGIGLLPLVVLLLGAGALAALAVLFGGGGAAVENELRTIRNVVRAHPASGEVHIVEIDKRSIEAIRRWPWPRRYHAQAVDRLRAAGVRSIAFDVDFSSESTAEDDRLFAEALARAPDLPEWIEPGVLAKHGWPAWRAAIDTVAKRQKPIGRAGSQWWPGGRSAEKPTRSPSRSSESTSAQAPPAACSAASHDPLLSGVSRSNAPPRALSSLTASTCSRGCTASSWSSCAAGASRRS